MMKAKNDTTGGNTLPGELGSEGEGRGAIGRRDG